jgi:hypothetical protein
MQFTEAFKARFWAKVTVGEKGECWLWTGAKHKFGYGVVSLSRKAVTAHRVSYALANGGIPDGAQILHRCDVPGCCNPSHLYAGTPQQNIDDMHNRGRANHPKHGPETRAKISRSRKGKRPNWSEEGRKARSESAKRVWSDPDFRARWIERMTGPNNHMYGKKPSAERMENIKRANARRRGTTHSEETKQKMREAATRREARKRAG